MNTKHISLLLGLLIACSNPYNDAKTAGTIEAYEQFLKENPKNNRVYEAKMALENLLVEKARETQALEDYDLYLKRFYEDEHATMYAKIEIERRDVAFDLAIESGDIAKMDKFITRYKTSDPTLTNKIRRSKKVAEYSSSLDVTPLIQEQVNLSGDESGPLDGWLFSLEITNTGEQQIETLIIKIDFLNLDGEVVKTESSTVIGIGDYVGREWLFESEKKLAENPQLRRQKPPFNAGETREWVFKTGDIPPSWAKQVKTRFSSIGFVSE